MSIYETAVDEHVEPNGNKYAYRYFGSKSSGNLPLLLMVHFRGNMDWWDPHFINPIAATRPVLLVDAAGIGRSGGQVPTEWALWAQNYLDVVNALRISKIDVLGFSMGGVAAQYFALNSPSGLTRRLILAGTTSTFGPENINVDSEPLSVLTNAETDQEVEDAILLSFYANSPTSQEAGLQSWRRILASRAQRIGPLDREGTKRQLTAATTGLFSGPLGAQGTYERLSDIKIPVFVANGNHDALISPENSLVLYQKLVNSEVQLHIFPDAGHGFLNQYAKDFSTMVNEFLDRGETRAKI
jgi:pimeloyl-ACP methyl ester carboxylesterase